MLEHWHRGWQIGFPNQAPFTLGVRADVQPESSIPIDAKVEINPKGFTLGVKAELKKIFSICPKLLINTLWPCIGPKAGKRIALNLGGQFETLGANVAAFINILTSMFQHLLVTWGQTTSPKCSKLAPSFFGPDSQCKGGLRWYPFFQPWGQQKAIKFSIYQ